MCNEIKDAKKRGEALIKAETDYDRWMDTYPEQSGNTFFDLSIQQLHDQVMEDTEHRLINDKLD